MEKSQRIKILLLGPRIVRNLGGPSLLPATIKVLNRAFQNAEYTFISPTSEDLQLSSLYGIKIIPVTGMWRLFIPALIKALIGISLGTPNIRQAVESFRSTDLVIHIWGIWFADTLGKNRFVTRLNQSTYFFVAKLFRKIFVKYTSDLGPFNSRWNRFFAKLCLGKATDLIIARNEITRQRLLELGITTPIRVCPDTGFLLESRSTNFAERLVVIKKQQPLVGMSVSYQAARQSGDSVVYIINMAKLADHIVNTIGATILFFPNEISENENLDDRVCVTETIKRLENKGNVLCIDDDLTASELKGIIGQCDINVASRYHTIVASLSQNIPVLVIGWHDKYLGLLRLVNQEDFLFDVKSLSVDDIKIKFDHLWNTRKLREVEIDEKLPEILDAIYRGGEETKIIYLKKLGKK
jgi:colanic acid/amylovoran biosynthesis protein